MSDRYHPVRRRRVGRKRRRWPLVLFFFLLLFSALVWFAPTIVANTPLKKFVIAWSTKGFGGQLSVGTVQLGWLSPIVIHDVVVHDPQGQVLLEAKSVRTGNHLAKLALNWHDLGTLSVDKPRLQVAVRQDGSNWEDALANWLRGPKSGAPRVACTVEVAEASIAVKDMTTGKVWTAQPATFSLVMPQESRSPIKAKLQTALAAEGGAAGKTGVDLVWQGEPDSSSGTAGGCQVRLDSTALPLDFAGALLQRFSPGVQLSGTLQGTMQLDCGAEQQSVHFEKVQVAQLGLSAPAWIGADRVAIPSLGCHGDLTFNGKQWRFRDFAVVSDAANLTATGTIVTGDGTAADAYRSVVNVAQKADLELHGDVDLAKCAALFPRLLRIREGTQITSGKLSVLATIKPDGDRRRWDGKLVASNIAATYQSRRLVWDQPVEVVLAAFQNGNAVLVDQLSCRSNFLAFSARGSLTEGSVNLSGDLDRFVAEVGQFLDLGALRTAGKLNADIRWRDNGAGLVVLNGQGRAEKLEFVLSGVRPLREERINLELAATARLAGAAIESLEGGTARLTSGPDRLELELLQAVRPGGSRDPWPVRLHAEGELARWLPRLQSVVPVAGWDLAGASTLDATLSLSGERVDVSSLKWTSQNLRVKQGSLQINEPIVRAETVCAWDAKQGQFLAKATTVSSTSLALRSDQFQLQWKEKAFSLQGDADYRLQLDRVLAWFSDPGQASYRMSGEATGRVHLAQAATALVAQLTADVRNFAFAQRVRRLGAPPVPSGSASQWQDTWTEPQLQCAVEGQYDPSRDVVQVSKIQASGPSMSLGAQGQVSELFGRCVLDLEGQVAYDLQKLVVRLGPLSQHLQLTGRNTRPFSLRGPLFGVTSGAARPQVRVASTASSSEGAAAPAVAWEEMTGKASLSWDSANIIGFAIGPGSLDAQLARGVVTTAPLDLAVNEGRLRLAPQWFASRTPSTLVLPAGPLVEQVQLSPEMCRSWIKFVAPIVADAAAAEGKLSISLDKATIPVSAPAAADVQGAFSVHSARIGPGPVSRDLLLLVEQVRAVGDGRAPRPESAVLNQWLELPAQNVAFRVADGRVYHENLQVLVDQAVIRTRGFVGFDQSLSLVAEVPIRDEWLARNRYLSALQGQVLQLPVRGTLRQPAVDGQAWGQITNQALGGAANRLLEQELNRGLDRLLRPR